MEQTRTSPSDRLVVLWTTTDRETAFNMVFMYTRNSKLRGWWDPVRLIIWGPSAKLTATDPEIADHLAQMQKDGVEVWACKACADRYGVSEQLEKQGIQVLYVGAPFTEMLKEGWKSLTV
ncbi:DsrE family protein [Desulfoglaeba alkanexedens]|nr:DsrE family protein [Desulfoglaeba alkanexedens]